MTALKLFHFLPSSSLQFVAAITVCLFFVAIVNAQANPFEQSAVTPQSTPTVDPFSSVPTSPDTLNTVPKVPPFAPETPQPVTPQSSAAVASPFETSQPPAAARSPFETTQPPAVASPFETADPVDAQPDTQLLPSAASQDIPADTPGVTDAQQSPVVTEELSEKESAPMSESAEASEEEEGASATEDDGVVKGTAPVRRPVVAQPASSWMSILGQIGWLPFAVVGFVVALLLWLLSRLFFAKKNKFDAAVENTREIDPAKSSFKKSSRFSESAIDGTDDAEMGSDVISEVGEVSGLRLNESDILAETPQVLDQSDLNFDAFDSSTQGDDFAISDDREEGFVVNVEEDETVINSSFENEDLKVSDDGLDDDDFASMMMVDEGEEEIIVDAGNDVAIDSSSFNEDLKVSDDGLDDDDFVSMMMEDEGEEEIVVETGIDAAAEESDELQLKDSDVSLDSPEGLAVEEETPATLAEEGSDEFNFDLDDDDPIASESDSVVGLTAENKNEISLEETEDVADVSLETSIDDSDEFDFGLDDDDEVLPVAESTSIEGAQLELTDIADVTDEAVETVGEVLDVDLEPTEPSNIAAGVGSGAVATGVAAIGAELGGSGNDDAVEEFAESVSDFAQEKAQLNTKIAELESKLSAAKSDSDGLKSLQAKLDESEQQRSESESKLDAAYKEVKELKAQQDQANADKNATDKLTEAEQKIEELESELSKSVKAAEANEQSLTALKSENELLKEEAADTQAIDILKEEVESAKQESEKLEAELKEAELVKHDSLSESEQLKSEVDTLKSEIERLTEEAQASAASSESADDEQGLASGSLVSAALGGVGGAALGATAKGGSEELEQEKKLRLETEAMLEEAEEHRTVVAVELRKVRKELRKLKEQNGTASAGNSQEREKLAQELEDAKAEITKLTQAKDELAVALADVESKADLKKNEVEKLTFDLEAQETLRSEAQQKISDLNDKIEQQRLAMVEYDQQSDRSALDAEITSLKQAVSESDLESKTAVEEVERSKQEIASLEEEITALKEAVSKSDLESKTAVEEMERSRQKIASLEEEVADARMSVREATEAKDAVQSKLDVADSNLAEKDAEIQTLQRERSEQRALADVVATQKTEILGLTESLASTSRGQRSAQEDLEAVNQQLKEARDRIEELNSSSVEAIEQNQKSERELRSLKEEKTASDQLVARMRSESEELSSDHKFAREKVAQLETAVERLKSQAEELESQQAEKSSAEVKILIEKNEVLSKQIGHLESASKYSETAKEELKEIIAAQKQRIGELETSANSARELASRQSESAAQSNSALLKIEAALAQQMTRMSAMEEINQQSLAKISQIQAAPKKRSASSRKSKSDSSAKLSKDGGQLSDINGVGPTYQKKLTNLGIKTIEQIATWSDADIKIFAEKLGCGETVTRDWKEKAKAMSKE